ncbi:MULTISPECIES: type II toxin-antitoxin system RelE/ParE family toxin [unclassified Sphingomonas]|uniref:type II toxin-antitoxin system RelE/ParE family toxin n=1 Tax=unclassified Sphingomonas TaxID=196159 RepID=UPI0022B2B09A|nr:type II toxin-antitoxin system RelE/ParE family toxin [Sphingomonas sp. NIBR02145]WHU00929.1 type II toxin-antitoxin system RelE/ParE family toxin [Sphingomonas sp. NIBR02145]
MLPHLWHPEALEDLETVIDFIEARNPSAARRIGDAIRSTADQLPAHSHAYRPGRVPGTREAVVHPNYILIYRVAEIIEVMAVFHARQLYP